MCPRRVAPDVHRINFSAVSLVELVISILGRMYMGEVSVKSHTLLFAADLNANGTDRCLVSWVERCTGSRTSDVRSRKLLRSLCFFFNNDWRTLRPSVFGILCASCFSDSFFPRPLVSSTPPASCWLPQCRVMPRAAPE